MENKDIKEVFTQRGYKIYHDESGKGCQDDKFLYFKPGDMPKQHIIFDEEIKCVKCHPLKIKDIDGYTAATMTLTQSKLGVMPKADIENL